MHPMTRANLEAALAGEAMAALRYRLYADRAEDDGLEDIEDLFESIGWDYETMNLSAQAHPLEPLSIF